MFVRFGISICNAIATDVLFIVKYCTFLKEDVR